MTPRNTRGSPLEYLHVFLVAVILAIFVRTHVVQAFKIPSSSMAENLLVGDHILVNKFIYHDGESAPWLPQRPVRRGDVVIFKFPDDPTRDFIKRCVALPGDSVEIVDKALWINGEEVDDRSYAYRNDPNVYPRSPFLEADFLARDNYGPYTVPDDRYFCLGDNRDESNDSRFWGPVPAEHVKGRAFLVYWSVEEGDAEETPAGFWDRIRSLPEAVGGFFARTRWGRCFRLIR